MAAIAILPPRKLPVWPDRRSSKFVERHSLTRFDHSMLRALPTPNPLRCPQAEIDLDELPLHRPRIAGRSSPATMSANSVTTSLFRAKSVTSALK